MTDERPSEVLGGLPRTRPHRRSRKRATTAQVEPSREEKTEQSAPAAGGTARPAPATTTTARPATSRAATPGADPPPADTPPAGTTPLAARAAATRRPASAPGATKRATPSASRVRQPAQPRGTPSVPPSRRPLPSGGVDLIGSAVNVTAELAELGISAGARALRGVVARLPRP